MKRIGLIFLFFITIQINNHAQSKLDSICEIETKGFIKVIFGDYEFRLFYVSQNHQLVETLKSYHDKLSLKATEYEKLKIDTFLTETAIDDLKEKAKNAGKFVWTKDYFPKANLKKRIKRNYFGLGSPLNYYDKKAKELNQANFNPYAGGINIISRPIFTHDYKFAFISVENYVGPLSAFGEIQVYIKLDNKWIYLTSLGGYIS